MTQQSAALPYLDHVTGRYPGAIAVNKGDFILAATAGMSGLSAGQLYPASSMPHQASAAADQALAAPNFAGVAIERKLSTDVAFSADAEGTLDVAPDWVGDVPCVSQAWALGDSVTIAENAGVTGLLANTVDKTTTAGSAIGRCVQDTNGVSVTTIRVHLFSKMFKTLI